MKRYRDYIVFGVCTARASLTLYRLFSRSLVRSLSSSSSSSFLCFTISHTVCSKQPHTSASTKQQAATATSDSVADELYSVFICNEHMKPPFSTIISMFIRGLVWTFIDLIPYSITMFYSGSMSLTLAFAISIYLAVVFGADDCRWWPIIFHREF